MKIGLLVAKRLFPSFLPAELEVTFLRGIFLFAVLCVLTILLMLVLETLRLNIRLQIPEWAPFHEALQPPREILSIPLLIAWVITPVITIPFFAWRQSFLQKNKN